jgi:hypothetical protein
MRFTRRVARPERQVQGVSADGPPTCVIYIPDNGRGDDPPGTRVSRVGGALLVVYDPAAGCPAVADLNAWPDAPKRTPRHGGT